MLNLPQMLSAKISGIHVCVCLYQTYILESCLTLKNCGIRKYLLERFYEWGQNFEPDISGPGLALDAGRGQCLAYSRQCCLCGCTETKAFSRVSSSQQLWRKSKDDGRKRSTVIESTSIHQSDNTSGYFIKLGTSS